MLPTTALWGQDHLPPTYGCEEETRKMKPFDLSYTPGTRQKLYLNAHLGPKPVTLPLSHIWHTRSHVKQDIVQDGMCVAHTSRGLVPHEGRDMLRRMAPERALTPPDS